MNIGLNVVQASISAPFMHLSCFCISWLITRLFKKSPDAAPWLAGPILSAFEILIVQVISSIDTIELGPKATSPMRIGHLVPSKWKKFPSRCASVLCGPLNTVCAIMFLLLAPPESSYLFSFFSESFTKTKPPWISEQYHFIQVNSDLACFEQ